MGEGFVPRLGVSLGRGRELATESLLTGDAIQLINDIYERGVAAGRRQAAEEIRKAHRRGPKDPLAPFAAYDIAARIAEGAPAEPVEEATDGR